MIRLINEKLTADEYVSLLLSNLEVEEVRNVFIALVHSVIVYKIIIDVTNKYFCEIKND